MYRKIMEYLKEWKESPYRKPRIFVAGSLLGVTVNREQFTFPVGKVDIKTLYSMGMEEFFLPVL